MFVTERNRYTYRQTESVNTFTGNAQHQDQVAEDPYEHQIGTEGLVRVVHALLVVLFGFLKRRQRALDGCLKLTVNVGLRLIDFLDEIGLGIILLGLSLWQCLTLVRSLGTPRNVMPVAEGVHHEDIDRAGHTTKVSPRGGEHVPRIHIKEASNEVDTIGRDQGNQDDTGTGRTEERRQEFADALTQIKVQRASSESIGDQVERQYEDVTLDDTEVNERKGISQTRTILLISIWMIQRRVELMIAYPLGRLPSARMNCSIKKNT